MGKTLALKKEEQRPQHELSAEDLANQARKVLAIKETIMKPGVHFGTIPGCKKPSLLKPGAEKLCTAFMLQPEFETTCRDDPNRTINWEKYDYNTKRKIPGSTTGYIDYDSSCTLVHIPTGEVWARKVSGSCNNFESKYRGMNPYDVKNTLAKMSEKRALVAAVLIGTALSDLFTQDIEDMPYLVNGGASAPEPSTSKKPNTKPKPESKPKSKPQAQSPQEDGLRMATDKQVAYIKSQLRRMKINQMDFLSTWAEEFTSFEEIPFHKVNDILSWIREQ